MKNESGMYELKAGTTAKDIADWMRGFCDREGAWDYEVKLVWRLGSERRGQSYYLLLENRDKTPLAKGVRNHPATPPWKRRGRTRGKHPFEST